MNKLIFLTLAAMTLSCGSPGSQKQVGNAIISILDASRLYGCVVGLYGQPVERIIAECGADAADLVRDVNTDLQLFQAKRMACPTTKKEKEKE